MPVKVANRDLRLGRLYMVTLEDEVAEAVGDALNADESGVAIARRRPRQFTFNFPIRGANADANPYAAGERMRRQIRAIMENTTLRLQGLYLAFAQDTEIDGWMVAGSGLLKYDQYGLTFGSFTIEMDSSYRIGGLRTHMPARRVELYDRRLASTPRDFKGIIFGTDFSTLPPLALTALPVGANNPVGYLGVPVVAYARTGFDGTGYVLAGMQHAQMIGFEQSEANQNLGDVVIYDRRGLTSSTPEVGVGTNMIPNPSFEYDAVGVIPALWEKNEGPNYTTEAFAVSEGWAGSGKRSHHVKAVHATTGLNSLGLRQAQAAAMPVNVGEQYTAQAAFNILSAAPEGLQFTFTWYKADNATQISSENGAAGLVGSTGLRTLTTTTAAAPAEAAFLKIELRMLSKSAATTEFYMDELVCVEGTAAPTTYFDGDSFGYFWQGTAGQSRSTIDPQNYGWEEVYGPDHHLSEGDVVVLTNQLCRIRYVKLHTALAIDTAVNGVWVEQGRVTLWDSPALDVYNQHNYVIPRSDGSWSTVMEWTPERAIIRISTNRSSSESTARLDTYITLQRGWKGPRIETYCNIVGITTPGCQVRYTPNQTSTLIEANPTTTASAIFAGSDARAPWPSSPGPTYQEVGEPWVNIIPQTVPGYMTTLTSIQQGARGPNYEDNHAYGGSARPSTAVCARFGENQNNTATQPTYGYVSAHIGFTGQRLTLGVFEAETYITASGTTNNEADAEASAGHAIKDMQENPLRPVSEVGPRSGPTLTPTATGGKLAAATYYYKVTALTANGETNAPVSVESHVAVSGTESRIKIKWASIPGATGYRVYRGTASGSENVMHEVGSATTELEDFGPITFAEPAVADTFLRTESPLNNGGKWSIETGAANDGTTTAANGLAFSSFNTITGGRWNVAEQANPVVMLELHVSTPGVERYFAVIACMKAAERSGYWVRMTETASNVYTCTIEKWVNNVKTTLKTITGVSFTTTNKIAVGVRNGSVSAWKNVSGTWSLIGEAPDTTYTTGYTGFEGSGSSPAYSNFGFGTMALGTNFSTGSPPATNTATRTVTASMTIPAGELGNVPPGTYGVWARVRNERTGEEIGLTAAFGANTVTRTNIKDSFETYEWVYVGQVTRATTAEAFTLAIFSPEGFGGGTLLDRVVLLPNEYRQEANPVFDGGRDLALACLYDSQYTPDLVER